jgi:predicted nuclease with TOPRIM domain
MSVNKEYIRIKKDIDNLVERKTRLFDECAKKGLSFSEYEKEATPIMEELYFLEKDLRQIQDPIMVFGKKWKGKIYTFEEFKNLVFNNELKDMDGYGYYATDNAKSDIIIRPSDIIENIYRNDFTHVIWFKNDDIL